ncbi:MAG TPA: esterase-like activity of phytase family protein [Geminicoccus sp.]|uniref:esterase-like activity of phytase family protein n=1 Tax=Geminicoccus sp. TaxID=2024832 RepID=UPI002B7E4ED7|nr:esterase-like activity of phytase family protein [Geminicoccus sp.]HWL68943.1 esterase-like activity of phytase family protein [Geminicoccus sp.]
MVGAAGAIVLAAAPASAAYFERVATFPVFENLPDGVDPATETAAEIIAATPDGMTLIYSDSPNGQLGFIDITDPKSPRPLGAVAMDGEPTSVTTVGKVALVGVNTSESYTTPSGHVAVVDLATREVVARCDVGGQPDSVAASRDGRFLALAIENERDEDVNDGAIPQLPAGYLAILDLDEDGVPGNCESARKVELAGLAAVVPDDPEPEFVDVNEAGVAAVTLQENNHIALVDLASSKVTGHFPAGSVDLDRIPTSEEALIEPIGSLKAVPREPDAVGWLSGGRLVTANEGDWQGGSRGFTVFDDAGEVLYDSGSLLEHVAIRHGMYPAKRAKAKGNEPEGIEIGTFGGEELIFVGSERASMVTVFADMGRDTAPEFRQVLPTGVGPEGLLAIPERNLFVVAAETDSAEDAVRSNVMIYQYGAEATSFPSIVSAEVDGAPIGFGALSGLAAAGDGRLFAVSDGFYASARIFEIDPSQRPAVITRAITVTKDGQPVHYDLEGIALKPEGGFWLVSEGNTERAENPTENLLLDVAADGAVRQEIALPEEVAGQAIRFGFEGVTVTGEGGSQRVVVAIQRPWKDDAANEAKLGFYTPASGEWSFARYPLDAPAGKGWVGLSEVTALADGRLALIERDNQGGPGAAVKKVTVVDLHGVTPAPIGQDLPLLTKSTAFDVLPVLQRTHGWTIEKIEGLAQLPDGRLVLASDNDGAADALSEAGLFDLGPLPATE